MNHRRGLLYLHIPKTAGTSLNAYMASHFSQDSVALHIEHEKLGRPWRTGDFSDKQLVAGHLKYDQWQALFDVSRYTFVTVLREPGQQVMSQLAWLTRFTRDESREEREKLHPEFQAMIARLARVGPAAFLESITGMEIEVFDNAQSRLLLSLPYKYQLEESHYAAVCERLASFDLVGLTGYVQEFALMLAWHMGWRPGASIQRLNQARPDYYKDIRTAPPQLQEIIRDRTRMDQRMYEHAGRLFDRQRQALMRAVEPQSIMQAWLFRRALKKSRAVVPAATVQESSS